MKRRWLVRCVDRNGRTVGESRFWTRRGAEKFGEWQEATAEGRHWFFSPVATAMAEKLGPIWTVEVIKE